MYGAENQAVLVELVVKQEEMAFDLFDVRGEDRAIGQS